MCKGLRIKGGVMFNGLTYRAVIHLWDNMEALGEPEEFTDLKEFDNEVAAFEHYTSIVAPLLAELKESTDMDVVHNKIDEMHFT